MRLPSQKTLDRLKLSPEVAWYLLSRGYELPNCPPKFKTPEPRDAPGAYFDPAKVDLVVDVFSRLRHTQGKWAGRPLTLRSWQIAYLIAPTYGWVRKDEDGIPRRIIRTQLLDIPRKNAKTTVGGGQAIYLTTADGEPGAQVYALASRKDQARFCFDPVRQLAAQAPDLREHVKALRDRITHPRSGSYFAVMSSAGDAIHGASPHGAFVDEVHVHRSRDLIDAVQTGTGARSQPLVMFATTADSGTPGTIYAELRERLEQLARGVLVDESFYGVVFGADKEDDPFDPKTWLKANPGLAAGDSPTMEFMKAEAVTAKQSPANLARFLRLHLGLRTKQETKYLQLEDWDRNASMVAERRLAGRETYGGLDLSATQDLTSLCWLFPDDERGGFDALWRIWTPEARLEDLDKRTAGAASVWVRQGLLRTTPGNVVDYDFIRAQIQRDLDAFDVRSLGFDPWNASQLTNDLMEDGAPMVKVRQGFATMSPPTKELQRLLLAGTAQKPLLRHGGNACVRWQVDNFAVAMDPAGNVKPAKDKAGDKIDAVASLITALSEAMTREQPVKSAYEDGGLEVV
ncbi:terminase large subunit [Streptomyces sp. NPDC003720]|uniref:terminase large subunit n=1 Tax=Streptomyces sp. NPDC003720 TaxID=3364684 RepID=UPI0036A2F071